MSIKFPNMKRFFSLFLAAVMMAGLLAVNAHAASSNKITDYGDAYGHWAYIIWSQVHTMSGRCSINNFLMKNLKNVLLFDIHRGIIEAKGGMSNGNENSKCLGSCGT